ncbi:hypothetical protein [Pseudomonas taiwanensis]|nr:hypothetical protein [Pseudomonas taiwanensis]
MTQALRFGLPRSLASLRNYADGQFVETGKTFDNVCRSKRAFSLHVLDT